MSVITVHRRHPFGSVMLGLGADGQIEYAQFWPERDEHGRQREPDRDWDYVHGESVWEDMP